MDAWAIIGGIGVIIGIVAGIVQIAEYLQKRRKEPVAPDQPGVIPEDGSTGQKHLTLLRQILAERFDQGELETLCFDLGVEYENLVGKGKANKARELVEYLARRERISELLELGKRQRPDIAEWTEAQLNLDMERLRARRDQADRARREMRERQRVVNLRPLDVTHTFKDRLRETRALCDHLADANVRLVSIVGRGGMGKTALVSRVLAELERGVLPVPGEEQELAIDGILYLSGRSTGLGLERVYADVGRMLGQEAASRLATLWASRDMPLAAKVESLLEAMQDGLYLILLDNLEDELTEQGEIAEDGLRLLVERCLTQPGGARLIVTSREQVKIADTALRNARSVPLREGLPEDEAMTLLRELDPDGTLGLQDAPEEELRRAARLTQGIPRALEILAGILREDPAASLARLLDDEELFGEQVVEKLVAQGYQRLGESERRVMEALAVFDRPVEGTAVAYLLHPWFLGVDVRGSLRRLVSGYFVSANRVTGEYSLHPLDREFAYRQLSEGIEAEIEKDYTRRNLELRAADFYASIRKPKSEWQIIDDLEPQLNEFEHRVRARDFDGACQILEPIDYDYLYLWGHYAKVVELREKLLEYLVNPGLQAANLGGLGNAYRRLGQFKRAIECYEQAISITRKIDARQSQGVWLYRLGITHRAQGQIKHAVDLLEEALKIVHETNDRPTIGARLTGLGIAYRDLGQFERAIEFYQEALSIARETDNRRIENLGLGFLGIVYLNLGQYEQAIDFCKEALSIAREIYARRYEAIWIQNLGKAWYNLGQTERATMLYKQSLAIALEIGDRRLESYQRLGLGKALLQTKPSEARHHCAEAVALDAPDTSHLAALALGIVLLHQGDTAAGNAFEDAIARCRTALSKTADLWEPRYTLATALVGQAVCGPRWAHESERTELLALALVEYHRVLEITSAPGVVGDALRDLELIRAAGVEGLEPVFELLEGALPELG